MYRVDVMYYSVFFTAKITISVDKQKILFSIPSMVLRLGKLKILLCVCV